jgi:hypothetical protein
MNTLNFSVDGLTSVEVDNLDMALKVLMDINKTRRVGETQKNQRSSRSHMILKISLYSETKVASLFMVDLAGSESYQEVSIQQKEESAYIKKSLSSLGRMIMKKKLCEKDPSIVPIQLSKN